LIGKIEELGKRNKPCSGISMCKELVRNGSPVYSQGKEGDQKVRGKGVTLKVRN
jgi:hypothetical protein